MSSAVVPNAFPCQLHQPPFERNPLHEGWAAKARFDLKSGKHAPPVAFVGVGVLRDGKVYAGLLNRTAFSAF